MDRVELKIYDAVTNKQKACVNRWKFQDAMMGERFITFTITSEDPIEWRIGDYCTYRDETFWLNNIPTVTQKAPVSTVQDGFTYENVKFDSVQEELTRCMMLDVTPTTPEYVAVLGTNHTGSSRFQLYCGETTYNGETLTPVCALALKIQANLDRLYPNKWHVYVDTDTTYTTSSGKVMLATHTDDKLLSFDNTTVAAALAMVNSEFDLDFIIRSREIKIGYALNELTADDVGEMFVFGYGKGYPSADDQGKGLFQIKQMANSQQKIVTRLRALGSTKNMPYRYYNKKYGGDSNPDLSQSLFPTNLQLPGTFLPEGDRTDAANAKGSTKWARNNARSEYLRAVKGDTNDSFIDKDDDAEHCLEGIREDSARWDGSNSNLPEIYPTIEGTTYGELREAGVEDMDGNAGSGSFQGTSVHPDTERVDSLLAVGYTDNGVLVDDANVGDGINPEETSYSTIVRQAVIGQTKLVCRPSEYGEDLSFEGDETELFTIKSVSPGKYFMDPTGGGYTSVLFSFWLSSASVSASIGYVVRVKQRVGASTTLIAQYSSAFTSVTGTATHEIALPELPDAKDVSGGQVNDITVTQLCDIVVTFAPVVSDMQGGGFTLSYMVGRSMLHPSDDYDPEYNWGPVDGGIAANGSFHVFIKDMGFDLTTTFTGDTPVMAMKSGRCVGREFEIGENIVAASVNGVKGYLLTLNRAQDSNLGIYYPSETDPISAGDYFVLLGISMPDAYIEAAEARLLMAATDYLSDNCETKFTYQPSIDDIYLQRQHDNMLKEGTPEKSVYSRLYAGLRFSFHGIPSRIPSPADPLPRVDITIQQVTITMGDSLTPKVDIVLNDDVQQSTIQRLTTAVDRIYNGSAYGAGGGANLGMLYELLLTEGGKMFLSKINDDVATGKITFRDIVTAIDLIKAKNGIAVGDFMPGFLGTGAQIWGDGSAEFESVNVRGAIRAAELVFNLISAEEGESIRSIGHGEIESVTINDANPNQGTATLKLDGDEWACIEAGDICRGLYNTINKNFDNAEIEQVEDGNGFRAKAGFFASYFKVTSIVTSTKGQCTFNYQIQVDGRDASQYSRSTDEAVTEHPCALMKFAVYGNCHKSNGEYDKPERQSSIYTTAVGIAPRKIFLAGVNDWVIKPENIKLAEGNIEGITVLESVDGTPAEKTLHGDAGFYCEDNIYLGGVIDQFISAAWEVIEKKSNAVGVIGTSVDQIVIDCDSNGNALSNSSHTINAWLMWSGDKLDINDWNFTYNGGTRSGSATTSIQQISQTYTFAQGQPVYSDSIVIELIGEDEDGFERTAHKSIAVIANRRGVDGIDGNDGNDGRGIVSVVTYYKRSDSFEGITSPNQDVDPLDDGWLDHYVEPTETGKYLWRFTRITYTSGDLVEQTNAELIYVWQDIANPNLLENTDFASEDNMSAWTSWWYREELSTKWSSSNSQGGKEYKSRITTDNNCDNFDFGIDSVETTGAYKSYKATVAATSSMTSDAYAVILSQIVYRHENIQNIEPSNWYTLSFYHKGDAMTLYNYALDNSVELYKDGVRINPLYDIGFDASENWVRHTLTFKSRTTFSQSTDYKVEWRMPLAVNTIKTARISMPKLEFGKIATDYRPRRVISDPITRTSTWEEGKQYYQGKSGEPYLDIVAKSNRWSRCLTTHVSTNENAPLDGARNLWWENSTNLSFVATDLLLADQAVIKLMFSQKILMTNEDNQLAASINADNEGSYCIYYPQTGNKKFEFSSKKDVVCYNDNDENTVAWTIGASGILKKSSSPSWSKVWLNLRSYNTPIDNSFNGNDNFVLTSYPEYIAGDTGVQTENGKIYKSNHAYSDGANGNYIADGWYTAYDRPLPILSIGNEDTWELEVIHIVSGVVIERKTITSTISGN